jgi:hypothetical protein
MQLVVFKTSHWIRIRSSGCTKFLNECEVFMTLRPTSQSTYIPRVPQCLSPRLSWDSLSHKRVCPSSRNQRGVHSRLRVRGWGSPCSDDWKKSLALCLLCGLRVSGGLWSLALFWSSIFSKGKDNIKKWETGRRTAGTTTARASGQTPR